MSKPNILQAAASLFNKKEKTTLGSQEETTIADKLQFWKNNSLLESIGNKTTEMQESAENFKLGIAILAVAGLLFALSLFYLPLVALMPQKFCALFSLSSILAMAALSTFMGHARFAARLFERDRIMYTLSYLVSLVAGIYFSCISSSYFLALLAICGQGASLAYILASHLPFGKATLNMVFGGMWSATKAACKACFKKSDKPFLPL